MRNFPGFHNISEVHEGERSLLFRTIRTSDQKEFILKSTKAEIPTTLESNRLQHEYEILKRLDSPGIIHAYGFENNSILMENFKGISLGKWLEGCELNVPQFLNIAIKMAEAISTIHAQRIIHNNITPYNILVDPITAEIRIIDFGIAEDLSKTTSRAFKQLDNFTYASPEQTGRMNKTVDFRSDFYSLGVTYYHMLANKPPFENTDELELIHAHFAVQAKSLDLVKNTIPPLIARIVSKLLEKNKYERYQSAANLLNDLAYCKSQWETKGAIQQFPLNLNQHRQMYWQSHWMDLGMAVPTGAIPCISKNKISIMIHAKNSNGYRASN